MAELTAAWGRADAGAYAACFGLQADYIAFDGTRQRGRAAIAQAHRELFDFLPGTRLVLTSTDIAPVRDGLARVITTGAVLLPWQSEVSPKRLSINSALAQRQTDGGWLLESFQNTRISPKPVPAGWTGAMVRAAIRVVSRLAGDRRRGSTSA